ncbi:di-heme-cytochrome C peroxidase [Reinekea sp. G2M2-21]|uniref:di-heme-cytochrome C peroxidase n=1 Tax=Reinekea sp. G2M2-21 TaxID=2788942 RepID=UPI001E3B4F74|nr:di-heme-cytochrome C peroxidase [Reinekea sp. G2M2-21]
MSRKKIIKRWSKRLALVLIGVIGVMAISLAIGKAYQRWDDDPDRGGMAISDGQFGEDYSVPVYLDQGWDEADSLWFYNITQGSALLPYDFYLSLEMENSEQLIRSPDVIDAFRYLPQKPTFFNPDGLAVGFVKDNYKNKDYMGFTCAACHTGQVNYQGTAIRVDGAPAMADMVGYLTAMEKAMKQTLQETNKQKRFVDRVIAQKNDYKKEADVLADLRTWTNTLELYNTVNHSHIEYGYARLDAFGRIYNRVLQYIPNRDNVFDTLTSVLGADGNYLLTVDQAHKVLEGINETIIGNDQFVLIIQRLQSSEAGYPALNQRNMLRVRNALFNEPNAPVSYPFLWDIAQSDYVQWNGIAGNAGIGPIGRNTGEVIGVFGILDWQAKDPGFSISAYLTKQEKKRKRVDFESSVDLVNLKRIENHLRSLKSPQWPEAILGNIDKDRAAKGKLLYSEYCQGCHEIVDRNNADRIIIGKFSAIEKVGTDPAMATNSVSYTGWSGNLKHTYQSTDVGDIVIAERAPVAQLLTSVTKGVVGTPDPDKNFIRRWLDWLYNLVSSFFDNPIKSSIKAGNYNPDTTADPYASLKSYKARSLNGIWATAPYLHNGSVPTLYDLLLPVKRDGDPDDGEYRPDTFSVGSREFDPVKVGFRTEGYDGFEFKALRTGDLNSGHEYAAGKTEQLNGEILPALTKEERLDLLEFLKTL